MVVLENEINGAPLVDYLSVGYPFLYKVPAAGSLYVSAEKKKAEKIFRDVFPVPVYLLRVLNAYMHAVRPHVPGEKGYLFYKLPEKPGVVSDGVRRIFE